MRKHPPGAEPWCRTHGLRLEQGVHGMSDYQRQPEREPSGWAIGGLAFAGCVLTLVGCFELITGLVAIFDDEFFVVARNYTFELDTSAWGWIHALIGLLLITTGIGLLNRSTWAGVTAIVLAMLSAIELL